MSELYAICQNGQIEDGDATGFLLMRITSTGEPKPWPILITRKGNNFYGFENVCPHKEEQLDSNNPGSFLDEDGNFLTCQNHGAQFDLDTGKCFIGPCQGNRSRRSRSSSTTATSASRAWSSPRMTVRIRTKRPRS